MRKVVCIVQARLGSTRLPFKMLLSLHGIPIIEWVLRRVAKSKLLDEIIVAIPNNEENIVLKEYIKRLGFKIYEGSEDNVLNRFYEAAKISGATDVVRVCADNPLICCEEIDNLINFYLKNDCDYAYNNIPLNNKYPDGLGAEIVPFNILENLHNLVSSDKHKEHCFSYIKDNYKDFIIKTFDPKDPILHAPSLKFDVDTFDDYKKLSLMNLNINLTAQELVQKFSHQSCANNIIVEVANTHEGDIEYLRMHIDKLNQIGAKQIKFQYIIPEELCKKGTDSFNDFNNLKVEDNVFLEICRKYNNINFYFDVFGENSLEKVIDLAVGTDNIIGVKIHATDSMNFLLIKKATENFEEVHLSISGLDAIEISELYYFLNTEELLSKIILVYGVQNYPTKLDDVNITKLIELKKIFKAKICLSEHIDGDNPLAKSIVLIANALGYDYVEKHSTLDRQRKMDDDHSALNIDELEELFKELNDLKKIKKLKILNQSRDERKYRNQVKKVYMAQKNLSKNSNLDLGDLVSLRQENNLPSVKLNQIDLANRVLLQNINANEVITNKHIKKNVYGLILVRNSSKRLHNKAVSEIGIYRAIEILIKRIKLVKNIDRIFLCTTNNSSDDILSDIAISEKINIIRGETNIYKRLKPFFDKENFDTFVRLTGDNIFIDPIDLDKSIEEFNKKDYDYYGHKHVIDGFDFEIISKKAYLSLDFYYSDFKDKSEYMTLYLKNDYFNIMEPVKIEEEINYKEYRYTLDYQEDLENLRRLYQYFDSVFFSYKEVCKALKKGNIKYQKFTPPDKSEHIKVMKKIKF